MRLRGFAVLAVMAAAPVQGQEAPAARRPPSPASKDSIPVSARPPAGMCRIWLDDVPVAQQPAPTDCPTALRNRPAKGRVIFGDDYLPVKRETTGKSLPFSKGFAPQKQTTKPPPPKPDTLP